MTVTRPGLLFVVNSLGPGGAEKHAVTLINRLDTSRFRLHLAYLKRTETLLPQLDTARLDELLCCDVTRSVDLGAVNQLAALIATRNIDVIVCVNMYSTIYGYLARRAAPNARLVSLFHTIHPSLFRTIKSKLQLALYKHLCKTSDLLMYVCENQRDYWRQRGLRAARDSVVHNGIDVERFANHQPVESTQQLRAKLGFGPRDYVIGLCAVMRPEKSHGDLLRALVRLKAAGLAAKALFIGDGPERIAIEAQIKQLGLSEHVVITGFQPDVRPYIECADVMTLASREETFSLAALECMAVGKPLVLSDVGGASEQILDGQTGLLFKPGDIDSLAAQLTKLAAPELRDRLGPAGQDRVRQLFTIDAMTAGFTDQMNDLIGQLASPGNGRVGPT